MDELENLEQQAVDAAIAGDWEQAVVLNDKIILHHKKNIDAYLRLGFAQMQLNKIKQSKKNYKKILKLQPSNHIALQNLEKIEILEIKNDSPKISPTKNDFDPNVFIEIKGKTKNVSLVNLGQKDILAQLIIGQEVILQTKKRKIEIRTRNFQYIGSLPDDLSKRMNIFIKAGSHYSCYIKEINLNKVIAFIKEEKKGKKVVRFTSFPQNTQKNLHEINNDEDVKESDDDEVSENDLYKMAEDLTSEEKIYIPYQPDDDDEDDEE